MRLFGHMLFWMSYLRVFCIFAFELAQRNWACFTWKSTKKNTLIIIVMVVIYIIIIIIIITMAQYVYAYVKRSQLNVDAGWRLRL